MNNIIIIPDSFKGTLDSIEVCNIMSHSIKQAYPRSNVVSVPVADGGEGTVDCFLRIKNGTRINIKAASPDMSLIDSYYGMFDDTAVIETAAAAGFAMRKNGSSPLYTTTYGVGELIRDAVDRGCKHIIIGLGGSCTNDGGCGMAAAMGTRFYNEDGEEFVPVGHNLSEITRIDASETQAMLEGIKVTAMCDTKNPLFGPQGAAYVFAPQKGASKEDVMLLDDQLKAYAKIVKHELGVDVRDIQGAGAAGGMGAGVCAFLGGELVSGIDVILNTIAFDSMLTNCSCIITGEGKFDRQSFDGKAVIGICDRAKKRDVPVIVVAGSSEITLDEANKYGIVDIFETCKHSNGNRLSKKDCRDALIDTMEEAVRAIPHN